MSIFVEKSALKSPMAEELIKRGTKFSVIDSANEVEDKKSEIILVNKKDVYAHPCPATKIYRCCNYHTSDVMEGCPFDCSYCILQAYLGHKNIQVSADTTGIINAINQLDNTGNKVRLGTGELSDSLALDHIFPFTKFIVPVINKKSNILFEFKTKSANISEIINLNPKNILLSWSLNPEELSAEEKGTAKVSARIEAAAICAQAGFKVGFHFDPLIYYDNFKQGYIALIEELISNVPEKSVEYISISTFRAPAPLLEKMRERPSVSRLLKADLHLSPDGKYRYFKPLRMSMLKLVTELFQKHWKSVFLYYCMEHSTVWEKLMNTDPGEREDFEKLFSWSKQNS